VSHLQMPGGSTNPWYNPGFTYTYPTYTYPRTTRTVTVEKFYDAEGRLVKEITTTVDTPVEAKVYTTNVINSTSGSNLSTAVSDSTSVVEPGSGKHRKKK